MSKVFRHPSIILQDLSGQYARGEIGHVRYMRDMAYILRRKLKKKVYECWGVRYRDEGNYPTKLNAHPYVITEALQIAPKAVCPNCGSNKWWFMKGAAVVIANCAGCGLIFRLKGADMREKAGKSSGGMDLG